jgi:serine/threonine-protein kinase
MLGGLKGRSALAELEVRAAMRGGAAPHGAHRRFWCRGGGEGARVADVFVSYKAEDRERVRPLVDALAADGLSVWWDAHISAGGAWRDEIERELAGARCVLVVWSRRSVGPEGGFVRDEASRALKRGAYLPVLIDTVEPPLGFGELQGLPLIGWRGDRADPRYAAVRDAVGAVVAGNPRPAFSVVRAPGGIDRRWLIGGGAALAALAAGGGWFLLRPAPLNANRIAVLPFANLSENGEHAYFADGIAEEIRAALSRIGLEVIGRASSVAVKDLDAKAAAKKLGVQSILSGAVRRTPQLIRVNAQLVSGVDGVERWSRSHDRAPGDAIAIQTDLATNVAQALAVTMGRAARAAITLGGTQDSVAQDLLLKAREHRRAARGEVSVHEAIALINAALARDPGYADAHVALASAKNELATHHARSPEDVAHLLAEARRSATTAIGIAPRLGAAHAALARIEMNDLNFETSLQQARHALALSPTDPIVLRSVATTIKHLGDLEESLALGERARALDPLSAGPNIHRVQLLLLLRRYPEALAAAQETLAVAPDNVFARRVQGWAFLEANRNEEAARFYATLPADDFDRLIGEAILAARAGDRAGMERHLNRLRATYGAIASSQYAFIYAQAGDKDRAFAELEAAVKARDPGLADLRIEPFLDPIRSDPRFDALMRRLRFPA